MKNHRFVVCTAIILVALFTAVCSAQSARVIPHGKISILEGNTRVGEFSSEMPVPLGKFMVCSGECLLKGDNFQVMAHDKAEFALTKDDTGWVLNVRSGKADLVQNDRADLALVTPDKTYRAKKKPGQKTGGQVEAGHDGSSFSPIGESQVSDADGIEGSALVSEGGFGSLSPGVMAAGGVAAAGTVGAVAVASTSAKSKSQVSPF